jgi:hypothetical protein
MKCLDCPLKYVGQTGRTFRVRYKEHNHAIRSNNSNSRYSSYINPFPSSVEIYSTLLPYQFVSMLSSVRTCLFRGSPFIFRSHCPRWPCMQYKRIRECFFCLLLPSWSYSLNFLRSECQLKISAHQCFQYGFTWWYNFASSLEKT